MSSPSAVAKFYAGRHVFVTGGAGFVGKQAVEKLLRSCPAIERVFVLVRPKRNKTVQQRLEEISKLPLFERLSREQPNFMRKLVGVQGDLMYPGLGISDADHNLVAANTSIVLHIAATVNFVEPIRDAVQTNIIGTRHAIQLARSLKKPEAFVHVSTAYSNADKHEVEEKVYDPAMEPDKLIALVKTLNPEQLAMITPSLLGPFPNTYTFTKGITERLIENEIGNIPCAIVRPSIITPTVKEPFEGWVDNITGFNGVMSGVGNGMMAYIKCTGKIDSKLDLIPVDITANTVITAAWDLVTNKDKKSDPTKVTVYNLTTGGINPLTTHQCGGFMAQYGNKYPLSNKIRKTSRFLHVWDDGYWLYRKFDQYIELPLRCYIADTMSRIMGKKPRATKTKELYCMLRDVLGFFTSTEWEWKTDNLVKLEKSLSPYDRKEFNMDRMISWDRHHLTSWFGIKKFVYREPVEIPEVEELTPADNSSIEIQPSSGLKQ